MESSIFLTFYKGNYNMDCTLNVFVIVNIEYKYLNIGFNGNGEHCRIFIIKYRQVETR